MSYIPSRKYCSLRVQTLSLRNGRWPASAAIRKSCDAWVQPPVSFCLCLSLSAPRSQLQDEKGADRRADKKAGKKRSAPTITQSAIGVYRPTPSASRGGPSDWAVRASRMCLPRTMLSPVADSGCPLLVAPGKTNPTSCSFQRVRPCTTRLAPLIILVILHRPPRH